MVSTTAGAAQHGISRVDGAQIDRNQRGLPVVDVEDCRDAELLGGFNDGAAEQAKALPVVGIVAALGAVKLLAVKEFRAIDKVILHPVALAAVDDADEAVVVLERDGDGADGVA